MTTPDEELDAALHGLGRSGERAIVVTLGTRDGVANGTRGYAHLYHWREVIVDPPSVGDALSARLAGEGIERIDVLHIETGADDWPILDAFDLARFHPFVVRLRRVNLKGMHVHAAVRLFERAGYAVVWFYDELVALSQHAAKPGAASSVAPAATRAVHPPPAAVYVVTYNVPDQFRLWLAAAERGSPGLLAAPSRFLLDNSTDAATAPRYDALAREHGFMVLRHGNLGITGGRVFAARHFDALPDLEGMYWFEDDMLLQPPDAPACRNGLRSHVPDLATVVPAIVNREKLDFLKLSFTEFFGDHHLNWAWYHLSAEVRASEFPDGTFRTMVHHTSVEGGVSYLIGNLHYDNWPTYTTRRGNAEMYLSQPLPDAWEGAYMARGFALQRSGRLTGGVLLASPIGHHRTYFYPREERREF